MSCDHCPIGDGCRSYPTLCENLAKNPKRWLPVVERVNRPTEHSERSEYPPIATQAANAVGAAARFIASGFATVDQAEFDRRHAICEICEHFDVTSDRCKRCGCSLAYKPWSKAESCPDKRWENG